MSAPSTERAPGTGPGLAAARHTLLTGASLAAGAGALAGASALSNVPVPCPSQVLFGLDCPLCGGTRAVAALADGRLLDAVDHNVLATVLAPAAVVVVLAAVWRLVGGRAPTRPSVPLAPLVLASLVVFAVVRNLPVDSVTWMRSGLHL